MRIAVEESARTRQDSPSRPRRFSATAGTADSSFRVRRVLAVLHRDQAPLCLRPACTGISFCAQGTSERDMLSSGIRRVSCLEKIPPRRRVFLRRML